MKLIRLERKVSLKDGLASLAKELREQAANAPFADKCDLLKRARRAHIALNLDDWANSPGLRPPK